MVWPFDSQRSGKSGASGKGRGGRQTAKKTVKRSSGPGFEWPRPTEGQLRVGLKAGAVVLVVGVCGYGWHAGGQALVDRVNAVNAGPLDAESVRLVNVPVWLPMGAREELIALVLGHVDGRPIDPVGLQGAALEVAGSPWVKTVVQVRRRGDGGVDVAAVYRVPVALVESEAGYHLIDRDRVRLPVTYTQRFVEGRRLESLGMPLPVVSGVSSAPPFEGAVWQGEDVEAGLLLLDQLAGQGWSGQVSRIDVGQRDEVGRVRLVLQAGETSVIWGLPPGQERAVEPDPPSKLAALKPVMTPGFELEAPYDAASVSMGRLFGVKRVR